MSDDAQASTETATEAPATVLEPGTGGVTARGNDPPAWGDAYKRHFADVMAEQQGVEGESATEQTEAATEALAKPTKKPEAAAEEAPEPADTKEAKTEQLKALAQELGMAVEDGKVSAGDFVELRKQRRLHKEKIERDRNEFQEQIKADREAFEREKSEWGPRIAKVEEKERAFFEARSFDERAQALGFKDWDSMIEDSVSEFSDPNYKKLRELEKFREEQLSKAQQAEKEEKERAEKQAEEEKRKQQDLKRSEATKRWVQGIQSEMKASTDQVLREFSDDPRVIGAIFQIQKANFDPADPEAGTVSVTQALGMKLQNGKTLLEQLREDHQRSITRALKAFGDDIVPEDYRGKFSQPAAPATPPKRAPKTQVVTGGNGTSSSTPNGKFGGFSSEKEWREKRFRQQMGAAIAEDERHTKHILR